MKSFLAILFLSCSLVSFCQTNEKNANVWYFGDRAGVDFNGPVPVGITDGQLDTQEGVSTICDTSGALIFYTDGSTIWDADHTAMPNGDGDLHGHWSSTQSAVIVPDQYNYGTYYVFTVDELAGGNGLQYSVVDMSLPGNGTLSNPKGDVTASKNIPLTAPIAEKVVVVRHSNLVDFWVITHDWNGNSFYVFEVNSGGVNTTPVVTSIGNTHAGGSMNVNAVGYMKASHSGDKIAVVNRNSESVDLFDFDNSTGMISNFVEIDQTGAPILYGLEFSSTGTYLFIAHDVELYRYNVQTTQMDLVPIDDNSVFQPQFSAYRALQIGPNGKIYVSVRYHDYLSVVSGATGPSPTVIADEVFLDSDGQGRHCRFGLPNLYFTREWYANIQEGSAMKPKNLDVTFDPASESIILMFDEYDFRVNLIDMNGKLVFSDVNTKMIDASGIASGAYMVQIEEAQLVYQAAMILVP